MSDTSVPFNIFLLLPTLKDFHQVRPVKTLDIFEGGTKDFHPDGLFSTEIFGKVGDPKRSMKYSYIDFKIPVFHPVLYQVLGMLKRMYLEIITGKTYAVWDPTISDFVKSNQLDGETGFHFFEQHWKKIKFQKNNSDTRNDNIDLINRFKDNAMCSVLVVMPAGLRDYEIKANGQEEEEEINALYRSMLSRANSINTQSFNMAPAIYNQSRVNIQMTFNDIYELIMNSIRGKKKLYMGKWATRAIHDTTRNVITTTNIIIEKLGDKNNPGFNNTIVGLFQMVKSLAPVMRFRIRSFLAKNFNGPGMPVNVVDKKTWLRKQISVAPKEFDLWQTDEGIDKILNTFSVESIRNLEITVGGEYVALLYKDAKSFKVFYSIDELPEDFDRQFVQPLRLSDLFYIALFADVGRYPLLNTRYPITGFGSIYPSFPYLKTTVDATKLKLLGEDWNITGIEAPEFPGTGKWFNSMSPAPSKLKNAGADFDGDKMSLIALMAEESIEEVHARLLSNTFYVGTNGKIAFSVETDTANFMMNNLISDIV
jgi:hypothetical protein